MSPAISRALKPFATWLSWLHVFDGAIESRLDVSKPGPALSFVVTDRSEGAGTGCHATNRGRHGLLVRVTIDFAD